MKFFFKDTKECNQKWKKIKQYNGQKKKIKQYNGQEKKENRKKQWSM